MAWGKGRSRSHLRQHQWEPLFLATFKEVETVGVWDDRALTQKSLSLGMTTNTHMCIHTCTPTHTE